MGNYIKRSSAIDMVMQFFRESGTPDGGNGARELLAYAILAIPAAEVVERKHGKWKDDGDCLICSNCHKAFTFGGSNFCPNCGCRMDGEDDD